ncbi:MAG: amidohydrolase [Lachnospiraceae bacterium]|nr:amidohydrolase [Lachnospiraceae bacterium]
MTVEICAKPGKGQTVGAEAGLHLPMTKEYVMKKLIEYGIEPRTCGEGVTALIGHASKEQGCKVLLLRADMDALPMKEDSGLEYAEKGGKAAHTCGHDCHAAMLLTAAKMLKEREDELAGTVKLMFQPAEETLKGSKHMIEHGILENPKVDAALAYHVGAGKMPLGIFMYNDGGTMMYSSNMFRIHIKGKGSHGAYPSEAIDPINIGARIHLGLQDLIKKESCPDHKCMLTIGQFTAGSAPNIIPDSAIMTGSLRAGNPQVPAFLFSCMKQIVEDTAKEFGGEAEVEVLTEVPPLICNSEMVREIVKYMQELNVPGAVPYPNISASASEDFAVIAARVPSVFMYLSAGFQDERGEVLAHNPKVQFNEGVLPIGAAYLAHCAMRWLEEQKNTPAR